MNHLPPPPWIGAPERFKEWRHYQEQFIFRALDSPKRFIAGALPTGSGKSLGYMGVSLLSGARTAALTATKGLQDQLHQDFAPSGLVDIRGQANYPCMVHTVPDLAAYHKGFQGEGGVLPTVAEGPCHAGMKCPLKTGGCSYFDAVKAAEVAQMVVTNYAYWFNAQTYSSGLGGFELLILDEAHNAADELSSFLGLEIEDWEVQTILGESLPRTEDFKEWKEWADPRARTVAIHLEVLKATLSSHPPTDNYDLKKLLRKSRLMRDLLKKLQTLAAANEEWVVEYATGKVKAEPIWPGNYTERYLFRGTKKVILVSATMRPKTLDILGVPQEEREFIEYPSVFPVARRPVIRVPTTRVDWKTTPDGYRSLFDRADQIIRARGDRKGIGHTVSYKLRDMYMASSGLPEGVLMTHTPQTTRTMVERFKRSPAPKFFVSPSLGTGWDFPYEECEYQIIFKVGFPDSRSAVMKARSQVDKTYPMYLAMIALVQAVGRGMRAEDDQCETFILDDNFTWFVGANKSFAPASFLESLQKVMVIPPPPPKLIRNTP